MLFSWIKRTYNEVFALASLKKKQRQFAWLLVAVCLLIVGLGFYKTGKLSQVSNVLFIVSGVLVLLGFLIPKSLKLVLVLWFFIGKVLGEITSTLVLFVVYFFAFFPITFFKRILKKEEVKSGWVKTDGHTVDYKKLY